MKSDWEKITLEIKCGSDEIVTRTFQAQFGALSQGVEVTRLMRRPAKRRRGLRNAATHVPVPQNANQKTGKPLPNLVRTI
jgi:hypothetical protein